MSKWMLQPVRRCCKGSQLKRVMPVYKDSNIMSKKMLLREYYELCDGGACKDLLTEAEKQFVANVTVESVELNELRINNIPFCGVNSVKFIPPLISHTVV